MNSVILLNNVTINQNGIDVLKDVNLSINKGEFIYLIGKTGIGKSSLLKILYGDIRVNDGNAKILDINLLKLKQKNIPYLRRQLGIVFQDFKLLPNKTIKENLEFVLKATEWKSKQKINDRIKNVLKKVNLEGVEKKYPNELSGGEQQRIAISRALLNDPKIILADEPTGNLDHKNATTVFESFLELAEDFKTAIVLVTHDQSIAQKMEKNYHLSSGKLRSK